MIVHFLDYTPIRPTVRHSQTILSFSLLCFISKLLNNKQIVNENVKDIRIRIDMLYERRMQS